MNLGKATEFDEFGLFRRQSKPELVQPLAEGILNTNGIGSVLETQYKIINIAHHVGFALETGLYRTLKPEIEHIVQVNIAQQNTDHAPNAKDNFEFFQIIRYRRSWNNT